jgi:hypothetical protein
VAGITWWTPERVEALRQLAQPGVRCPQIAAALSRRFRRRITPRSIEHMAGRNNIPLARGRKPKD